jgi:hypothetical protein
VPNYLGWTIRWYVNGVKKCLGKRLWCIWRWSSIICMQPLWKNMKNLIQERQTLGQVLEHTISIMMLEYCHLNTIFKEYVTFRHKLKQSDDKICTDMMCNKMIQARTGSNEWTCKSTTFTSSMAPHLICWNSRSYLLKNDKWILYQQYLRKTVLQNRY